MCFRPIFSPKVRKISLSFNWWAAQSGQSHPLVLQTPPDLGVKKEKKTMHHDVRRQKTNIPQHPSQQCETRVRLVDMGITGQRSAIPAASNHGMNLEWGSCTNRSVFPGHPTRPGSATATRYQGTANFFIDPGQNSVHEDDEARNYDEQEK